MAAASVPKLYKSVIEDVINNVREAFLDEGVDEQILIELKQTWEKKLSETKALEPREQEMGMSMLTNQQGSQMNRGHNAQHAAQISTAHLIQQQQARHASLTHQLTLPAGNLVPQTLLQYTSDNNDSQKQLTMNVPQKMTITLPAQLAQGGLHTVMSAPAAAATLALPAEVTASLLQQAALSQGGILNAAQAHALQAAANAAGQNQRPSLLVKPNERGIYQGIQVTQSGAPGASQGGGIIQLDGADDTSDDDDDEEDFGDNEDDREDNDDEQNENEDDFLGEEEVSDPLNSDDDVSDDDPSELFETDNVVVCQYDKITRSRNRWKFHLKDGIMNLQGRDFVFQKAVGDAEW